MVAFGSDDCLAGLLMITLMTTPAKAGGFRQGSVVRIDFPNSILATGSALSAVRAASLLIHENCERLEVRAGALADELMACRNLRINKVVGYVF